MISYHAPALENLPAVPEGGTILILWGGSPDVLQFDDARERLNEIRQAIRISDIVFSDDQALFSMVEGFGEAVATSERLEFPDMNHIHDVVRVREASCA